ncbi:DivIVA domain-containing protein [Brevibacterium sp. NPDC049920]|uniref:DivIVA domain-containing protein n=1 Tax=Brevibacterium pityocampae TaxID=506594 RepID=A0ABP8JIG1_9MICO|nr:DivIVA domain-containing protein [uncultured Brevibacterium sp.]
MPMWIVLGVCAAVFFMAVAVAGAFNLFNGGMPAAGDERPRRLLASDFTAGDLEAVAFSPAIRGYRMDEVDAVYSEMAHRIRLQEDRIAVLESRLPAPEA